MNVNSYYEHQARARGVRTADDVQANLALVRRLYRHILSPWLPDPFDVAIYEVACGPGIFLSWLRECGYTQAIGTDLADVQVRIAKEAGLSVRCCNSIEDLQTKDDGAFDTIVAIDFLEHLPKDVMIEFFCIATRKLKPGGSLILRGPNGASPFVGMNLFNDITHYWAYTPVALRALLQMCGFSNVVFNEEGPAKIQRLRWLKQLPMLIAKRFVSSLARAAIGEAVPYLEPSIWVCARTAERNRG